MKNITKKNITKKNMTRTAAILLAAMLTTGLCACGNGTTSVSKDSSQTVEQTGADTDPGETEEVDKPAAAGVAVSPAAAETADDSTAEKENNVSGSTPSEKPDGDGSSVGPPLKAVTAVRLLRNRMGTAVLPAPPLKAVTAVRLLRNRMEMAVPEVHPLKAAPPLKAVPLLKAASEELPLRNRMEMAVPEELPPRNRMEMAVPAEPLAEAARTSIIPALWRSAQQTPRAARPMTARLRMKTLF